MRPRRTRQVNDERIDAVRSGAKRADVVPHGDFQSCWIHGRIGAAIGVVFVPVRFTRLRTGGFYGAGGRNEERTVSVILLSRFRLFRFFFCRRIAVICNNNPPEEDK